MAAEGGLPSWSGAVGDRGKRRNAAIPRGTGRGKNTVLNGRQQLAFVRKSGSWLQSQSGRLLSGLGLAAISPRVAGAARKDKGRGDDQDRQDNNQNDRNADRDNNAETKAENQAASDKRDRSESRQEDDGGRDESEGDQSRGETRRQDANAASDETSGSSGDETGDRGARRSQEFEQRADDVPAADEPATTTVTPANPTVVIDDVPDPSITDLVVEANDDVIASVSTSGGFAFARSGDVTAVTGPDGASIIQTGASDSGSTPSPAPDEPSADGGNNDLDFSS